MPLSISDVCQAITPSVTLAIDARAKALCAQGADVIGFGAGEPDFPTPEYICDAAREAIAKGMTRYTPAGGTASLKAAIIQKLSRDNGLCYKPDQIIVSNGAKHALLGAMLAILNPGDEVIIPSPCWVSYPEMVRMAGGVPVFVPTAGACDFIATADDIAPYVTARTKALILNSPSNPNGCVYTRAQLEQVAALAVERAFYVISDEIYEKLLYDGYKHISIASLNEAIYAQTIVVNGVSKSYAMTGWRIGYAAGPKAVINAMTSYQSHATSNPNSIAQYASEIALKNGEETIRTMCEAFDARRKHLVARIRATPPLCCNMPHGAFYVMMDIGALLGKSYEGQRIDSAMTFASLLLEKAQVAVVPGEAFMAPTYCRLSYAVSMESMDRGMDRIAAFIAALT